MINHQSSIAVESPIVDEAVRATFERWSRLLAAAVNAPLAVIAILSNDHRGAANWQSFTAQADCYAGVPPLPHCYEQTHQTAPLPLIVELAGFSYLGQALVGANDVVYGVVCSLDDQPRTWTTAATTILADVAAGIVTDLELYLATQQPTRRATNPPAPDDADLTSGMLNALVSSATSGIALLDRDLRYRLINPMLAAMNARSVEQHLGRTIGEILPIGSQTIAPILQTVLATGEAVTGIETTMVMPHTTQVQRSWETSFFPVYDSAGTISGVGILVDDISERKLAEQALLMSEAKFRAAADSSLDALFILESMRDAAGEITDFVFVDINHRAEQFVQMPRAAIIGQPMGELFPINRTGGFIDRYVQVVQSGESLVQEFALPLPDGVVWVQHQVVPLGDGITITTRDITERKQVEETLRISELRYRGIFDNSAFGIAQIDANGQWLHVNDRLCTMLGYSRAELLDSSFQAITHPDDLPANMIEFRRLWADEIASFHLEKRYRRENGAFFWATVTTTLQRDAAGAPLYGIAVIEDSSLRKATEAALEQARHKETEAVALLESLLLHAPIGFAFFDREYRYVRINETLATINGIPVADHLHQPISTLLPVVAPAVEAGLEHVWTTKQALLDLEIAGETPAAPGVIHHWITSLYPVLDDGAVMSVGVTVLDITARKQAEAALQLSENRYRTLINAIPQLVWTIRTDGGVDFFNQRWYDFTSLHTTQALGAGWVQCIHIDDRQLFTQRREQAFAADETYVVEVRLRRYDGAYIWHLVRVVPLHDADNQVIGWFGAATDIHDRKLESQTLAFLSEASSVLASSLDSDATLKRVGALLVPRIADYCVVHLRDDDGLYRQVMATHKDHAQEQILLEFGATRRIDPSDDQSPLYEVVVTQKPVLTADISQAPDAVLHDPAVRDLYERLHPSSVLTAPLLARGAVRGVLSLVLDEVGQYFTANDLVLAQEISLRIAVALDNARLYAAAQEAVREREALLSVASHELKNPLTSLLGYANLLERRANTNPAFGERELKHVRMIREQGARLTKMLDVLLDVARLDSGQLVLQPASVDLSSVVDRMLTEVDTLLTRHTILYYEPEAPAIVQGDEMRLEQVVRNLLGNAIKYSPDGGEIVVRLHHEGEQICLDVQDRGIGIPTEALPRIFQRFSRVNNTANISGLGLGLYVVREIVALHGGSIAVASTEGVGSTFTVTLPAHGLA